MKKFKLSIQNRRKSAQDIQDEIFKKMTAAKKIKAASELTMFCLKLNKHNNKKNSKAREKYEQR